MTANLDAYADYSQARVYDSRPDVPGNLQRALALYERAVGRDPGFAEAHAGIGRVSLALYQSTRTREWVDRARRATLEALRLAPTSAGVRYAVAFLYSETGQHDTARLELETLLARHPEHDDAHRLMGRLLVASGDLTRALDHLETARRLRPGYWDNQRALGLAYFDAGRFPDAIAAFERLTELQPDSAWAFQVLGTAHHAAGHRAAALDNYRKAIALTPSARAYSNIGTLLFEEARFQEAAAAYRHAIELRPKVPLTHRNLGDALLRLGRRREASAAYRTSAALARQELEVSPDDPELLALEAYCLARLGRVEEALATSGRAAALAPSNHSVLFERAVIFVLAEQPCPALEWLGRAVARGYSVALAAKDADLHPLAGHPRFEALVGASGVRGAWAATRCGGPAG
jgi:tetratricopeptide (TPR) repeat protein